MAALYLFSGPVVHGLAIAVLTRIPTGTLTLIFVTALRFGLEYPSRRQAPRDSVETLRSAFPGRFFSFHRVFNLLRRRNDMSGHVIGLFPCR